MLLAAESKFWPLSLKLFFLLQAEAAASPRAQPLQVQELKESL